MLSFIQPKQISKNVADIKFKLQGPAPKPKNNFNNIPFATAFHEDTDNKIIMKNITRKIENIPSDYTKGICQESNMFLSQCQPKNLLRLAKSSLPKPIFKCNDKSCKICRLYIIECFEFELVNRKIRKIKQILVATETCII